MRKITATASFIIALTLMVTSFATFFVKSGIALHVDAATTVEVGTVFRPFTSGELNDEFKVGGVANFNAFSTTPFANIVRPNGTKTENAYMKGDKVFLSANNSALVAPFGGSSTELHMWTKSYAPVIQFVAPADGGYGFDIKAAVDEWTSSVTMYIFKNNSKVTEHKFTANYKTYENYKPENISLNKGDVLSIVVPKGNHNGFYVEDMRITYVCASCVESYAPIDHSGHNVVCSNCDAIITANVAHKYDEVTGKCKDCGYSLVVGTIFYPFAEDGSIGSGFGLYGVNPFSSGDASTLANTTSLTLKGTNTFSGYLPWDFKNTEDFGIVDGKPLISRMTTSGYALRMATYDRNAEKYAPMVQFTAPADGKYELHLSALKPWNLGARLYAFQNSTIVFDVSCNDFSSSTSNPTAYTVTVDLNRGDKLSVIMSQSNAEFIAFKEFDIAYVHAHIKTYESIDENTHKVSCADSACTTDLGTEQHTWDPFEGNCSGCKYACEHNLVNNNCTICGYCNHTAQSQWKSVGDEGHVLYYSCCNRQSSTVVAHQYVNGKCKDCSKACAHPSTTEATCTVKAKCNVCGASVGALKPHVNTEATCTTKAKCKICGTQSGGYKAHKYTEATCIAKAKCTVCGKENGELLEHDYSDACCDARAKCKICKDVTGELLSHTPGADATETTPQTCTSCGYVIKEALAEPVEVPDPDYTGSDVKDPSNDEKGNDTDYTLIIIIVAVSVVVVAAIVCGVVIIIKKKRNKA